MFDGIANRESGAAEGSLAHAVMSTAVVTKSAGESQRNKVLFMFFFSSKAAHARGSDSRGGMYFLAHEYCANPRRRPTHRARGLVWLPRLEKSGIYGSGEIDEAL